MRYSAAQGHAGELIMGRIDETRPFLAVNIAVLTVSGHADPGDRYPPARRSPNGSSKPVMRSPSADNRKGRCRRDRSAAAAMDRRSVDRCRHHHRRHRDHRARRHSGSVRPGAGEKDRRLRRVVPHVELSKDRHIDDSVARDRGRGWGDVSVRFAGEYGGGEGWPGRHPGQPVGTTGSGRATSWN